MNFEGIGTPIFSVSKSSKLKMGRKPNTEKSDPNECQYCCKKTTPKNKARHEKVCSMKKAGIKKDEKIMYASSKQPNIKNYFETFETEPGQVIQHIPNRKQERDILYISARSGAGKSWYAKDYANKYREMYPKRDIYLFSGLEDDKGSIDKIKNLQRIKLDSEFMKADITLDMMKNSMLIFDDIDIIDDKLLLNKLYTILNMALQTGRHSHTSVIFTTHTPCNGQKTKICLAESHSITLFVPGMGNKSLKYLLDSYYGLDKKQIEKIKSIPSRWVTLTRTFPSVCFHQNGAFVL